MSTRVEHATDVVVDGLAKDFSTATGPLPVLRDVTFQIPRGQFLCIVGPSGCGKTTLLRILLGLEDQTAGSVKIVDREPAPGALEYGTALIEQEAHLLPWRSLFQNAMLGRETKGAISRPTIERLKRLIEQYGLRGYESFLPSQLSGGMRQRVAVLRALAFQPHILLCDEPFASIDFVTRLHLAGVFKRNCKEGGVTTIFVTHNIDEAIFLGDRVLLLGGKPASVKGVYDTSTIGRMDAVEVRKEPDFREMFDEIWRRLKDVL